MAQSAHHLSAETGERASATRRWLVGTAVVLLLIVYPAARWMLTRPAAGAPRTVTHITPLDLSYQLYEAGRYEQAIQAAQAALAVNPNSADAYNNLAVSYAKLGRYDEGIDAARRAVGLKPDYQLARNNLAWIESERAKRMGGSGTPDAGDLLNLSLAHSRAGRFAECIDTATQAARLDPKAARAFNNIGFCAASLRHWDDAIHNLQHALAIDPTFQLARNNLAWATKEQAAAAGLQAR